uniref:Uncharacterized protein n=1 Tax=Anopheles farauti TaxID=69004 RepID=A0A182Q8R1_9DIPT
MNKQSVIWFAIWLGVLLTRGSCAPQLRELTRVVMAVQPPKTQQILRVAPPNTPPYVQVPQVQRTQSQYERELAQYRLALAEYQQKTQPQQRVYQAATVPQQPIYQQPQYVQQPYYQQPPQNPYNYYSGLQQQTPPMRSSSNSISSFTGLFDSFSNALGVGSLFGF